MSRSTYFRPRLRSLESRVTPATIFVTNANDSGLGSLRAAVDVANFLTSDDTVIFDPAAFPAGSSSTISLTSGPIVIGGVLDIIGPGADRVTVHGKQAGRIFELSKLPQNTPVKFEGLTLTGGKTSGDGGAVLAGDEDLTLRNCVLSGNSAANGGAVAFAEIGGTLRLDQCVVANNSASKDGGGVFINEATTTYITATTVSGNAAELGGGASFDRGSVMLRNSTFSGNTATVGGGAIDARHVLAGQLFLLNNCTISENVGLVGGGLLVTNCEAKVFVENCTVTKNTATTSGGGLYATGTKLSLESTVLSGNLALQAPDSFSPSSFLTVTASALGVIAGPYSNTGTLLPLNIDLKLGPLADNGGPTRTHLPAADSPLVNMGTNPGDVVHDQRGAGYYRFRGGLPDIGAVEATTPFVVTNDADSGPGSLRQAVADASAYATDDTITFDATYFATPRVISLTSGAMAHDGAVTILGPGASNLTVRGNLADRILDLTAPAPRPRVHIVGVTFTRGRGHVGGAIRAGAVYLDLRDCVFTANAVTLDGGAVFVGPLGTLNAEFCVFSGNAAMDDGGAIYATGPDAWVLRLHRTTVANNAALDDGGGVYVEDGGAFIEDSTFADNTAGYGGGGLCFLQLPGGTGLVVRNSTLSGNSAQRGGAVKTFGKYDRVFVEYSTIVGNSATDHGGGLDARYGAGITLESSVVSGNSALQYPDIDGGQSSVSRRNSAVGSADGFTVDFDLGGNLPFGTDVKLGPLAANGGPTKTHLPLPGSPLINNGHNSLGLPFDQRGAPFTRAAGGKADIGAVEAAPPVVKGVQVNDDSPQRSRVTSLTVTYSEAVTLPAQASAAFTLERVGPGGLTGSVRLAAVHAGYSTTLTFQPGGTLAPEGGSLPDGIYRLTVLSAHVQGANGTLDGDGNLIAGGDFATPEVGVGRIHRLFGDIDGDGDVDAVDYGQFRGAFGGTSNLAFDFDGDGDVDAVDFGQFRQRFGSSV